MHAPVWVCKKLAEVHPQLRLAWCGDDKAFAIVQLYHISDCGDIDEPFTYREYWHVTTKQDEVGGYSRARVYRGPIFSKKGVPEQMDWDPLTRVPIFVCTFGGGYTDPFDGHNLGHEDVFSGRILPIVRRWLRPIYDRVMDSAREAGRRLDNYIDALGSEMASRVWWEASQTGQTSPVVAKKFMTRGEFKTLHRYYNDELSLKNARMPPQMSGYVPRR